jgi:hypothetical protein
MKVLVIGGGGREHALVWKLRQSPRVSRVYCAPGNAGIGELAELVPLTPDDVSGLRRFAEQERIDLTVVGPELSLSLGLVDEFAAHGLRAFGPHRQAAQLEASKAFAKELMRRQGIPTPYFGVFTDPREAQRYVSEVGAPVVVKADGSVLVHADSGGYKPLNWMSAPCSLADSGDRWEVSNLKGERLIVHITETVSDQTVELGEEPGLAKDGVEADLQALLAEHPYEVEPGLTLVRREHMTAVGPVDLLCRDEAGCWVAVEIKRRGEIDGVEQLMRYLECLEREGRHRPIRGVLVGQKVVPQARTLAAMRGLGWAEVDYDRLRGLAAGTLTLF